MSIGQLLLLPSPPSTTLFSTIDTAYGAALQEVLHKLTQRRSDSEGESSVCLDIALATLFFSRSQDGIFPEAQSLLARVYRLLCMVATKQTIDLDLPGGVDVRIFLVTNTDGEGDHSGIGLSQEPFRLGPIVDMRTLAARSVLYNLIFSLENEQGEGMRQQLISQMNTSSSKPPPFERVQGDFSFSVGKSWGSALDGQARPQAIHNSVAVGGTFDHLHTGHKLLLTATALVLQAAKGSDSKLHLTVGITGDELLVNKKHADYVEAWDVRQRKVAGFLEHISIFPSVAFVERGEERINAAGPNGRRVVAKFGSDLDIDYVQISDPFGPTITDESISALVVSKETSAGGKAVNDKRQGLGWALLEVFEVDVLDATESSAIISSEVQNSFQTKISSTEIRSRLQNRSGHQTA